MGLVDDINEIGFVVENTGEWTGNTLFIIFLNDMVMFIEGKKIKIDNVEQEVKSSYIKIFYGNEILYLQITDNKISTVKLSHYENGYESNILNREPLKEYIE